MRMEIACGRLTSKRQQRRERMGRRWTRADEIDVVDDGVTADEK